MASGLSDGFLRVNEECARRIDVPLVLRNSRRCLLSWVEVPPTPLYPAVKSREKGQVLFAREKVEKCVRGVDGILALPREKLRVRRVLPRVPKCPTCVVNRAHTYSRAALGFR